LVSTSVSGDLDCVRDGPVAALLGFVKVGMTMTARARASPVDENDEEAGVPTESAAAQLRAALKDWAPRSWLVS